MGMDVSYGLVAWNDDGSSALLERDAADSEGDADTRYVLLRAHSEGVDVEVSTSAAGDPQGTDRASCRKALRELKRALAADHLHGVHVNARVCKRADRTRAVDRSWVAIPSSPQVDCEDTVAVANGGGLMVLEFRTPACDGPTQMEVTTLVLDGAARGPSWLTTHPWGW